MKTNLEKELVGLKQTRKTKIEKNEVLQEVQKLLENDTLRDVDILRNIGSNSSLAQSEEEKGKMLEIEKHEKFYSGTVFRKEEIIKLATMYRLKFLPSAMYSGYISPEVATEVKNMEREMNKSMIEDQAAKRNISVEEYLERGGQKYQMDKYELQNNFFILAPIKLFKLADDPEGMFSLPKIQIDPILFYKIDDDHFRLIKKWGSDFTILRRIKGWLFTSSARIRTVAMSIIGLICFAVSYFTKFKEEVSFTAIAVFTITLILAMALESNKNKFGSNFVLYRFR